MAEKWKPSPEVKRACAQLGADLKAACEERKWSSLTMVARRTGLTRGVVHSIFQGRFVRQSFLLTLINKLDKQLQLGPKDPAGAGLPKADDVLAKADDVFIKALAARLSSAIIQIEMHAGEVYVVDRRLLMKSFAALFADTTVPESIRWFFVEPKCPSSTADDIEALAFDCSEYLQRRDATAGGGAACDIAIAMHQQATDWLGQEHHGSQVSRALEAFSCELGAWVGWLGLEAGRLGLAKHYLGKTIADAHVAGLHQVEARAWDTMCLLLQLQGHPEKSLHAAHAGLHAAELDTNPKLRALFCLGVAKSSAMCGDARVFAEEVAAARRLLEREPRGPTAPWFRFLTTGAFYIGEGHLALGQVDQAMVEYRSIIEAPSTHYHSNVVRATVQLGRAFAVQRDYTQAGQTGLDVLPQVVKLSSDRIRSQLRQLRNHLSHQANLPPRALEFIAVHDAMTMPTT